VDREQQAGEEVQAVHSVRAGCGHGFRAELQQLFTRKGISTLFTEFGIVNVKFKYCLVVLNQVFVFIISL